MNRIILLLIAGMMIWTQACKNNSASNEQPEIETSSDLDTSGFVKSEGHRSVNAERAMAETMLEDFYKQNNPPLEYFTTRYFTVEAAHQVRDTSSTFMAGEWFVLSEDWTYRWYKKSSLLHTGRYSFAPDKNLLLLLSDQEDAFPTEWTMGGHDEVVIMIGTSTFRNNDIQIKLEAKITPPYKL